MPSPPSHGTPALFPLPTVYLYPSPHPPPCTAAAAAAAKLLQSCPTLRNPIDGSPPGSPVPGILQARTLEWVAIAFSSAWKWKVQVKSLGCVQPCSSLLTKLVMSNLSQQDGSSLKHHSQNIARLLASHQSSQLHPWHKRWLGLLLEDFFDGCWGCPPGPSQGLPTTLLRRTGGEAGTGLGGPSWVGERYFAGHASS